MNNPLVSVVIPVFNAEKYLAEAVESILRQTYTNLEILLINDGSTDGSKAILKKYALADPRIKLINNEQNIGLVRTLNTGLDQATGKYIARMDADDISVTDRIKLQVDFLENHSEVALLGGAFQIIDSNEVIRHPLSNDQIKIKLLSNTAFAHPTVMMRTAVFKAEDFRYDENYRHLEDFELWTRVAQKHELANLKQVVLHYRIHPTQVTSDQSHLQYRIDLANNLRLTQLKRLGLSEISTSDLELHLAFMAGNPEIATLGEYITWANKLKSANYHKKYVSQRSLDLIIFRQLFYIACRKLKHKIKNIYRQIRP